MNHQGVRYRVNLIWRKDTPKRYTAKIGDHFTAAVHERDDGKWVVEDVLGLGPLEIHTYRFKYGAMELAERSATRILAKAFLCFAGGRLDDEP